MTDPIKWFISILLGCAQWRKRRAEEKQRGRERCEREDGEDVEERREGENEKRREEGRSKIKSVWFWWIRATADCRSLMRTLGCACVWVEKSTRVRVRVREIYLFLNFDALTEMTTSSNRDHFFQTS